MTRGLRAWPRDHRGGATGPAIGVIYVLPSTFVVGRTTRRGSRKSFYAPFTPHLRLQPTGCLLLGWPLPGQAGPPKCWWPRRPNAQGLCHHLATGVPAAIQPPPTGVPTCPRVHLQLCSPPLTGVPTCPRVYLQLHSPPPRVCLRAHGCAYSYTTPTRVCLRAHGCACSYTSPPHGCACVPTGVPCRRLGGGNWPGVGAPGVGDWGGPPAGLGPPRAGWPWQPALRRAPECQQTGHPRSHKAQCTKCGWAPAGPTQAARTQAHPGCALAGGGAGGANKCGVSKGTLLGQGPKFMGKVAPALGTPTKRK